MNKEMVIFTMICIIVFCIWSFIELQQIKKHMRQEK